jgi:SAM-dependent methyltransferase
MMSDFHECRSCGRNGLRIILDMGCTPLANALLESRHLGQPEPVFPLVLALCTHCALVQILATVKPENLYNEYYYFSSFADTMLKHAHQLSNQLVASRGLGVHSLVVEAASNDGYLLQYYKALGIPVLGIEPARNVAEVARSEKGIPTRTEFFSALLGRELRNADQCADIFHANNVLAHVADLNGFVCGIRTVLKDDGLAVIEVPYVKDMIDGVEFDTIYHEHLCYFSLTALNILFRRHDLLIQDVERLSIHGGSIRIYAVPMLGRHTSSARVDALLEEESHWGATDPSYYHTFGSQVGSLKTALVTLLETLKCQQKRIAGYGASAKGSTLLNYFGIGSDTLDFVVDRSTIKQGRFTPGTHLPILAPEALLQAMPDYVLLLTWNFADEITRQQTEYRRRGGRFITPIPQLKVA